MPPARRVGSCEWLWCGGNMSFQTLNSHFPRPPTFYVFRASDSPLEMEPDIWNEIPCKSLFWRCFERWNVSCCSIRFNDFWRRVSFVVFPQPAREWKEKTKINFQVFLYNHHKGITEALWKAFRSFRKILHTSVPRKGSPTWKQRIPSAKSWFLI